MGGLNRQPLRYLVIEGPIGVGKTSLARRLAEDLGGELLLEQPEENPFLERFYSDPHGAALPVQLHFLLQRARQMRELQQADLFRPLRVADFLFHKDRLFAGVTLDEEELALYEQVHAGLGLVPPVPDLVVYLQAPIEVLVERIRRRDRRFERYIDTGYLQRLCEAYTDFFHHYDEAPLLIVNATEIDFVANPSDYRNLLARILDVRSGREYYNPLPFDLDAHQP
ncbi:MAG TPA: deoxynucleoside kinase [Chromatiales bacterium]|nr:deoxynucleoside kinase [Chromatiales bacterium]